jgi:hypothetical protein
MTGFRPIFVLGVPRSGTTLLRVILGAHPLVLGLPETPWLLGSYGEGASLRGLLTLLAEDRTGIVQNVAGVQKADVYGAGRAFLEAMFAPILARRGKKLIAFKTPDDIKFLEFLVALFPDASYVHICRDGRDVALSYVAKKGSWFARFGEHGGVDFFTMFRRWHDWESKTREILSAGRVSSLSLRYEDLVARPEAEIRRISGFLGIDYDPAMLRIEAANADLPAWEAGSSDVRARRAIGPDSVGRWRQARRTPALVYALTRHGRFLAELGYDPEAPDFTILQRLGGALYPVLAPVRALADRTIDRFMNWRARLRLRSRAANAIEKGLPAELRRRWSRIIGGTAP